MENKNEQTRTWYWVQVIRGEWTIGFVDQADPHTVVVCGYPTLSYDRRQLWAIKEIPYPEEKK